MTVFFCKILPLTLGTLMLITGCGESPENPGGVSLAPAAPLTFPPARATNALARVAGLIENCTPRDSGTPEALKAAEWLRKELQHIGVAAAIDRFEDPTPRGNRTFANVIGELRGEGDEWIVLLSHFDTKSGMGIGFQGANDSGSSTGLLLEIADALKNCGSQRCNFLFGFMDGEECMLTYSENDGFHGSKRFAQQLKNKNTRIRAVIGLDMIGDRDLKISIPRNSTKELKLLALKAAETTGHRDRIGLHNGNIYDDHQAFLDLGYPAVLLIDFHFGSRPGSNDYWHTMEDSLDKLSAESLLITGRIAVEMINQLQK